MNKPKSRLWTHVNESGDVFVGTKQTAIHVPFTVDVYTTKGLDLMVSDDLVLDRMIVLDGL
jgi:hypothetical protein